MKILPHWKIILLRIAITLTACAAVWLLVGCASTTIRYTHIHPNTGEVIEGSYTSTKNLEVEVATNGTLRIKASASEATDANTRLLKQATESFIEVGRSVK